MERDFCGWEHRKGPSNCLAYKKKCNDCKQDNHFERKRKKKAEDESKNECKALDAKDEVHYASYDELLVVNNHPAVSRF